MNIFVLDLDHDLNAQYHCDKHVSKMILESVQLLSTAVRMSGVSAGYKITHINHPCTVWTRYSLANWLWLRTLVFALHDEWNYRGQHNRMHKSYDIMLTLPEPDIENIGLTPFRLCMPDEYKNNDAVIAYRNYYRSAKQHLHSWKCRPVPEWINNAA